MNFAEGHTAHFAETANAVMSAVLAMQCSPSCATAAANAHTRLARETAALNHRYYRYL